MALAFDTHRSTRDVDVVIHSAPDFVRNVAAEIGESRGWSAEWLNDGAAGFVAVEEKIDLMQRFSPPGGAGLRVQTPSAEYLFAMTCMAMRPEGLDGKRDRSDIVNKQAFLSAVQTDETMERVQHAVAEPVPTFNKAVLAEWAEWRLAPECEVYTDGLGAFNALEELGYAHTTVVAAGRREMTPAKSARWVNVVLANIKRSLSGAYHSIRQRKYARRYLAEAAWRFNGRLELKALVSRLAVAMVACGPHSESASEGDELCALRISADLEPCWV